jgi:hypothetical protein
MRPARTTSLGRAALAAAALALGAPSLASAQLDPLIALKRVPPNIVVVVDTSFRMLDDGTGTYYDPMTYVRTNDPTVAAAMGVPSGATSYRRKYVGLDFENVQDSNTKFSTTDIVGVPDTTPEYATFWSATRLELAKAGLTRVVGEHTQLVRWGLLKLRQDGEAWRTAGNCDKPVRVTDNAALLALSDTNPCNVGGAAGRFGIAVPVVSTAGFSLESPPGDAIVQALPTGTPTQSQIEAKAAAIITVAQPLSSAGGQIPPASQVLIPAGRDTKLADDRPLSHALDDARAHVVAAMEADATATRACRNSVVVLLTGGGDDGDSTYRSSHDAVAVASTFAAVEAGTGAGQVTRRVPIVVIGIKPDAADEAELMEIAEASGGRYFAVESVDDVAAAMNFAVQLGFQQADDLDAGQPSEYTFVSPVVATVNLVGAVDAGGTSLSNTEILSLVGATQGQTVPQRSNVLITAGFALPGFDGRLRAFRTFVPEEDPTKPTGWRFVQDGTRLWPDLDGRPELAGQARTPASPAARNIYTFIPNGTGGGTVVPFTEAESAILAPHLGGADPAALIPLVRSQPLGAVINSTPAVMDPPSLDPPPDTDYGYPEAAGSYAALHQDRRSMIFVGANDGMIHAIDARTGYEVWAFIPYNLLPKLRTLADGQAVEQFDYFVDSSPKLAEVKVGGAWKTMLIIGQGYGGTFYQAFDVSEAGMGVGPTADGLSAVSSLLGQFDTPSESIQYLWSFPDYNSFDPNITAVIPLTDGFPGGRLRIFGDLKATATDVEKRVGFTFSDPAVGPMTVDRSVNAVITGSGYFPGVETSPMLARGGSAPAAGRYLFVLSAATGLPLGGNSSCSGTGCYDVGVIANAVKNAIQADVTASGDFGSPVVTKAYVGDLDGRYFRFDLTATGAITGTILTSTGQPIYASSALLFVGSSQRYLFFSTGSDQLPNTTPGGAGTFKLFGVRDSSGIGIPGTVTLSYSLASVSSSGLLTNGERPTSAPTVAGDIVFFSTTAESGADPCGEAVSRIYAFTYLGTAAYDANGSGKLENNESRVVATAAGRATAPFIVDQHLFISTTAIPGASVTMLGDPADFNNGVGQVGVRILSWREIR